MNYKKSADEIVGKYFKNSKNRVEKWWDTPNSMFGGVRPIELMSNKPEKALEIIKKALSYDEDRK